MKIKNKRELVLRAKGHARLDHIEQGTYGDGYANGHVEFKGCAIGCLAAPHRKAELRAYINGPDFYTAPSVSSDNLIEQLGRQFGVTPPLARAAEAVFENLDTHGAAINFIPAFAEALPEGVDIRPDQVHALWERLTGWHEIHYAYELVDAEATAEKLLDWLRSKAKS